eukprot:1067922-Pelagomonas_calceolata.AAC.6
MFDDPVTLIAVSYIFPLCTHLHCSSSASFPSDTTNKEELREELDAIEGSTSIGEISSLVGSLTQISRLDTDALQSSSAEAASPPSDADGSLQALKRALMMLHGIATELSVNGLSESQQTRQGLLPFLDARLDAIGQVRFCKAQSAFPPVLSSLHGLCSAERWTAF